MNALCAAMVSEKEEMPVNSSACRETVHYREGSDDFIYGG